MSPCSYAIVSEGKQKNQTSIIAIIKGASDKTRKKKIVFCPRKSDIANKPKTKRWGECGPGVHFRRTIHRLLTVGTTYAGTEK